MRLSFKRVKSLKSEVVDELAEAKQLVEQVLWGIQLVALAKTSTLKDFLVQRLIRRRQNDFRMYYS